MRHLVFLSGIILLCSGCLKEPAHGYYKLTATQDTINVTDSATVSISVATLNGTSRSVVVETPVTWGFGGNPSVSWGIPPFTFVLKLYGGSVPGFWGQQVYPVYVSDISDKSQPVDLVLNIMASDPAKALAGTYAINDNYDNKTTITRLGADTIGIAWLQNSFTGTMLYAVVNPADRSFIIPQQIIGNYTYQGTGTITPNVINTRLTFNYTVQYLSNAPLPYTTSFLHD